LKFIGSSDKDGRIPNFRNNTLRKLTKSLSFNQTKYYQIQFETLPGHGQFELTAEYNPLNDTFIITKRHLSRLNKYGHASV
ncbi:unnamed protein product, partial [Rotaria magnacalcarata]